MMTVHEVSKLTGVSIRTLQYYDKIGLLKPANHSESGYRLYNDADMERLQQILLFKELEFPLKEIKIIINSSDYNKNKALDLLPIQSIWFVFPLHALFEKSTINLIVVC